MSASNILKRASILVNFGYGEDLRTSSARCKPSRFPDKQRNQFIEKIQKEYKDEETGILNREGRWYLK